MTHLLAVSPDAIWVFAQKAWWFLVVIGVLISFHELGHLLAARLVGVRVLKYSLGFGPTLFGRKLGETDYVVSAVPLGGYVKLFGEEDTDAITVEEKRRSFFHQALSRKMFIVAAGPGFNFVLAYVIFAGWLATGAPLYVPSFPDLEPVVKAILPDSPADAAGLQIGDKILTVNDREISIRDEVIDAVQKSKGHAVTLDVQRGQLFRTFVLTPEPSTDYPGNTDKPYYRIGIEEAPPQLTAVQPGSPAMDAGFQKGDRVVSIEGTPITTWSAMTTWVRGSPDHPLHFQVKRDGHLVELTVIPQSRTQDVNGESVHSVTIGISRSPGGIIQADTLLLAFVQAGRATWMGTEFILQTLVKLFTGEVSRKSLAGPLGIATMTGEYAEHGYEALIWLIAFLSINLGVLNPCSADRRQDPHSQRSGNLYSR